MIMKKMRYVFVAAFVAVTGYGMNLAYESENISDLWLADIESMAACESIGWWNNDGNCVSNDAGVYFCKSDSWPALTDCKQ